MTASVLRFGRFVLDPDDRRLSRDGVPVDLNARYLDALALLVREPGKLVSKDRFLEEVWRGVPVTDEALTQCIRTLRRQLGDNAAAPIFIETVPKHGYRFIAQVENGNEDVMPAPARSAANDAPASSARRFLMLGGAGTIGGGVAGLMGGLFYGFLSASKAMEPGMGAVSVLLVLVCVTMGVATVGAAGVALGIAASEFASARKWLWSVIGGAAGGLIVGAFVKLIGLDALDLLFGRSPGDITGAAEGALLGGAIGLGARLGRWGPGTPSLRRGILSASLAGGPRASL